MLRSTLWAVIVAAVVGGATGALVSRVWGGPSASAGQSVDLPTKNGATDLAEVERRLGRLEQLAARQEALRRLAAASGTRRASNDEQGDGEQGKSERSQPDAPIVDDPVFEAAVRDVVDRVEEEQDARREERQSQRREQMATAWARDLEAELGLSEPQREQLQALALEFFESMRGSWQRQDEGADAGVLTWAERRAQGEKLREGFQGRLGELLSPAQLARYQALEPERQLGTGFGRGSRGR